MSVATNLAKLESDISSAYSTIGTKGGTIPSNKNTDNLSTAINSIQTGGTPEPEEKDVCLYDYDGTRLYSYTKSEFQALEELPSLPTHEGLVAQEWNYTLANAKTYLNTYDKLDIGATYDTTHHGINLYLDANKYILNNVTITTTTQAGAKIEWGDGTTSNVNAGTDVTTTHNYSQAGYYKISIYATGQTGLLVTLKQDFIDNEHKMRVDKVEVGECVDITAAKVMYDFEALETISLAKRYGNNAIFSSSNGYTFQYCRKLKAVIIPRSGDVLPTYLFSECGTLERVIFADTFNSSWAKISQYCVSRCYNIKNITYPAVASFESYSLELNFNQTKVVIPKNAKIRAYAFNNARYIKVFDFTHNTSVSTLDNANAFTSNYSYKIVVPDSLYSTWRTTSPWNNSSIVNNIVRKSDFDL